MFIMVVSMLLSIITIICTEVQSTKNEQDSNKNCNEEPPVIKNGKWVDFLKTKIELSYKTGTELRLICNAGYVAKNATSIKCLSNGEWTSVNANCKRIKQRMSYYYIYLYAAVGVIVIITIIIGIVMGVKLYKKRKKKEPIVKAPKWARNQEERHEKYSSEIREHVYKDLVEERRKNNRTDQPSFILNQEEHIRTTKVYLLPLEDENGYLVAERKTKKEQKKDNTKKDAVNKKGKKHATYCNVVDVISEKVNNTGNDSNIIKGNLNEGETSTQKQENLMERKATLKRPLYYNVKVLPEDIEVNHVECPADEQISKQVQEKQATVKHPVYCNIMDVSHSDVSEVHTCEQKSRNVLPNKTSAKHPVYCNVIDVHTTEKDVKNSATEQPLYCDMNNLKLKMEETLETDSNPNTNREAKTKTKMTHTYINL